MKKLTLFLVAMLFSALSFAALNPYAYGLKSDLSDDEKTVTLTYSLNANATSVNIVILDGETVLKTQTSTGTAQGTHSVEVSTDGFPEGKTLSWKVEVKGAEVTSVAIHDVKYNAYHPSGIDIDNNPESPHFGRILCTEAMHSVKGKTRTDGKTGTNGTNYLGTTLGAGIYEFDPAFTFVKGYNGEKTFVTTSNHYAPRRIRIAKDGRIFATAQDNSGEYLWEINPDNLDSWTSVFQGTNSDFTLKDGSGKFIAGTNSGFDVRGTGENLQLLMLSANKPGGQVATFKLHEYNLGDATTWSTIPTRELSGCQLHSNMITNQSQVQYDSDGGYWITYWVNTTSLGGIAHFTKDGTKDYSENSINMRNAGFRFNHDFTKVIIATNDVTGASKTDKQATVYAVSKDANGVPVLTKEKTIDMTTVGNNLNDFAWDYADNIYVVGNSSEYVAVYPYTHTADKVVSTPCRADEAIVIPAPAQLNPFAYGLSSELINGGMDLKVNYSLNAPATSVEWVLMDGTTEVKRVDLSSFSLAKGDYTTTIPTIDFPTFKQLTWKIEVKGVAVSEPTEVGGYRLFHPSGVDVDNNPENATFGLILTNEALHRVNQQTSTYLGAQFGSGIFAFNAAFEPIKNGTKPGFNGGNTFTHVDDKHYPVRRVRITEDGRIFVTGQDNSGNYLWEVDPDNLDKWTSVFQGTKSDYKLTDASNKFIVGTNSGFDVRGSGENLQLLMLSGAVSGNLVTTFKLHEYNIGAKTTWSSTPTRELPNCQLHSSMITNQSQVLYDNEGGYWITYWVNTTASNLGGIAHFTKEGNEDFSKDKIYMRNAGIRFNNDYTKLVIATSDITGASNTYKHATIYAVSKGADGKPKLTKETTIDMTTVGSNLNDFAWDYANNIYAVGNSGEWICAYAMPHSSDDVVATPAASKYAFSIGKYTVTALTNDENKGTVTGGGEYGAGAVVTLTATPKEGYELLYWSDRSKENPRTITVDGNEALSAYFIKKNDIEPTFSITKVWENTNVPDVNTNGYQAVGWDGKVYLQASADSKIMVYNGIGAATEYATSGAGYQIAVDEVGNLIVYNGYFATATPNNILIYEKDNPVGKEVTFTLPQAGRCDFFSASGDIYSAEGGYVYFYCQNTTVVNRLKIKNGAATAADVTTDVVGGNLVAGSSQNHVIKDIFGNLVAHSRLNGIRALNVVTNEVTNFYTLPNLKTNTLGGCSFELSGKEFWAYNMGTTAYTSEWNLYNVTDGQYISAETLCTVDKTTTNKNQAANWLNAQVVDEKTAYIYQYCPTVGIAMWKVTRDHIVSATAENGTVEGAGTYKDNATATLTATANDGYLFKNWTTKNGAEVSKENPYSFTVTEDVELVANFDGPFCELILNTNDEAKGTVSGAGFYNVGQTVTIKATPKAGYKLLYWSDRSTQNPRTITMNKKEALSAYFVKVYDEEPTFAIEKVWENTNVPTSTNNGYQAVGWDGKIYMQNKTDGKIQVFSKETDALVDYATSGTGQQIAVDEAGNLIVFNESFADATPSAILIYQNGSTTGKTVTFTLKDPAACHFFSASGDIYSAEGGYVYFYCNGKTAINRLKITNGAATAADVTTDLVGGSIYSGGTQNHVMVDIFGNLVTHARSNSVNWINVHTNECKTFTLPSIKLGTLGGCSFELGGKELWAYHAGNNNYSSEWNLYNMTDGKFMSEDDFYLVDKTATTNYAANWLNVQVVDEETAYIYQFCPLKGAAVWKVSLINTVVIDDKADNTTALAEYEGQTVTAKVTRAFNNDSYKTLTLPFDMDEEQIKAVFGETAIVHEFTSVGEENDMFYLHFDPTTTIEAGKPYIIQLPTTGDYDAKDGFTIENVTINTTLNPVVQGAITMQPVLDGGGRLSGSGEYWLASDNYLYSAENHPTPLLGLRAYFINNTGRPIRARVVYGEDEATSIPTVVAPEESVRKVMKDGQIIIIRGEKKYNIQGQVIE